MNKKLTSAALIPARLGSTRLPRKLMLEIARKTVIRRTYENAANMDLFDMVAVVSGDKEILEHIESIGGEAILSEKEHKTGSDRIAAAARKLDFDIVVDIQGDAPFISRKALADLLEAFADAEVDCASLTRPIAGDDEFADPNSVKVVVDARGFALYFSRSPIPFNRDGVKTVRRFKHIGVYAFRKATLLDFASAPQTPLEISESLEQLRMLERGVRIKMVETDYNAPEIDTIEDITKAENFIKGRHLL